MYSSIITHTDLDGVASAALCSFIHDIDDIKFTGPGSVDKEQMDEHTIVCDLPYARTCGLWFDHHIANEDDLRLRGINAHTLPGCLADMQSCLRVIYTHYKNDYELSVWEELVGQVDIVDSFLYATPEEWLKPTPIRTLDTAIKFDPGDAQFLRHLTLLLRDVDFHEAVKDNEVIRRSQLFKSHETSHIDLIRKTASFLDTDKEIILIDLTNVHNPPSLQKNLAFTLSPEAKTVLELRCRYERGIKTNDLYFSMSLGFVDEQTKRCKNLGEIMRVLGAGSGHAGSAAGHIVCPSKIDREKMTAHALETIQRAWQSQRET